MYRPAHILFSCKVPGCKNVRRRNDETLLKFYGFPRDAVRLNAWNKFCRLSGSVDTSNYRICMEHFQASDFRNESKQYLLSTAVPSLKPASRSSISESTCALTEHDYCATSERDVEMSENPGTSTENEKSDHLESVSAEVRRELFPPDEQELAATTSSDRAEVDAETNFNFLLEPIEKQGSKTEKGRHGYLKQIGLKLKDLTPQKLKMYDLHRATLSRLSKLKSRLSKEQNDMHKLKKLYESKKFEVIENGLNAMSKEFINNQLSNYNKKSGGKRYTDKFKMFALTLYKRSPRLYRYLQVHFELPSTRVLKKLLNSVPFETGFNSNILQQLKSRVSRMSEANRFCTLIFDEMQLDSSFYYDKSRQKIVEYEDLGEHGRRPKNANHALVFMIQGLRRRWKQRFRTTSRPIPSQPNR